MAKKQAKKKRRRGDFGISQNISRTDKRQKVWTKQRATRGFDDTELWSLYYSISLFLVPRLREFANRTISYPHGITYEQWRGIVNEMAEGFAEVQKDTGVDHKKLINALSLFKKYFNDLWS